MRKISLQEFSREHINFDTIGKEALVIDSVKIGALLRIADALEEISDNNARTLSVLKEIRNVSKT